jgi:hypothetical protein
MRTYFVLILITLIAVCCKKDNYNITIPLNTKFVIDSTFYRDFRAEINYKLNITGGISPIEVNWISPSENKGIGPFQKRLNEFYTFEVVVSDSVDTDTIIYKYDYRDKLIGKYICNKHELFLKENISCIGSTVFSTIDSTVSDKIDTLSIVKSGTSELSLLQMTFRPDSSGKFIWYSSGPINGPHTAFYVQLLPKSDSLYVILDKLIYDSTYFSNYRGKQLIKRKRE